MFKMSIPVTVAAVKAARNEKSNNYADFLFLGGLISVPVDDTTFQTLKALEGKEITGVFEMRPSSIVKFDRPASVFEPVKFLGDLNAGRLSASDGIGHTAAMDVAAAGKR